MSDSLTGLTNFATGIASAATDIATLFSGGTAVTLGGITLQAFEVPETIRFANAQALVMHRLPGGARIIDCLGPNPSPITWTGIMLGGNASSRAQLLQAACDAGKVITLSWSTFSFQVIINLFEANIGWSRCDYTISVVIKPQQAATATASLKTGVLADIGYGLAGVGQATTALTTAASATIGVATTVLGTAASFASAFGVNTSGLSNIATGLSNMQSITNSVSGLAEGSSTIGTLLSSATGIGGQVGTALDDVGNALDFTGSASSIVTTTGQGGVLASLSQAAGYVGRTAINLGQQAAQPQSAAAVLAAQASGAGTVAIGPPTSLFTVQ